MIHKCTEMEAGEKTHDSLYSMNLVPTIYNIVWSEYSKRFELRSQLHIELAGISYCPFCGTNLNRDKNNLEQSGV